MPRAVQRSDRVSGETTVGAEWGQLFVCVWTCITCDVGTQIFIVGTRFPFGDKMQVGLQARVKVMVRRVYEGRVCARCPRSDGNTTMSVPVTGLNQRTVNFGNIWVGLTQFDSALSLFVCLKKNNTVFFCGRYLFKL